MELHIVFLCLFAIFVSTQFTSTTFEDAIVIISKNYSTPDVTYTDLPSICNDCLIAFYDDSIIIIQNETVINKTRTGDTWTTMTKDLTNPIGYNLSNLHYNGQSFTQYNNKLYAMPGVSSTEWSDLVIFDLETMDYLPYGNYTSFAATFSGDGEPDPGDEFYRSINGTCLTVLNDVLYVIGGYYRTIPSINDTQYETYVFSYNITSDSWSNLTNQLSTARAFAGCASVDDNIYVFGGHNGEPVYSVEKYDAISNVWTTLDVNVSYSSNYLWCSYMEYEEYIYCFGGEDFIQIFDPHYMDEFVVDNVTVSHPYHVSDPRVAVDNVNGIMYVFDNGEENWQFVELDPQTWEPTMDPTKDPTRFPTESYEDDSFLRIVCKKNDTYSYDYYTLNLTEENGFEANEWLSSNDELQLNNITIPVRNVNDDNDTDCYLRIFLSNKDYWGYRQNTTCTLGYSIDINDDNKYNKNLNMSQLDISNILNINQQYNTWWNVEFLSNTEFQFGAWPICQTPNNQLNESVTFANEDVQTILDQGESPDLEFGTTTSNTSTPETLTSSDGFWPYEFYLKSDQLNETSKLGIKPAGNATSGQACIYDEALPTYNYNTSMILTGGIDYILMISANGSEMVEKLNVNIEISQYCEVDDDFFMLDSSTTWYNITSTEVEDEDGIEWWELLLIILGILLGWMIVCCILVYYCRRVGNDETRNGMSFTGVPGNTNEDEEDNEEDEEDVEDKTGEFVVSERDHREMVEMMKKQSMSTGLEEVEL